MKEYQVSYRGGRFVTRDNIIEILEELNFHPGAGEGGGFELDGITNWYLLTDQDEGVQLPDMDLLGTDACNWTTTYQPPTANTGESCVWRFTDFRYKDGSTQENPILHIYVGPELITKFTSGGGMGVEFAYALFDQDVTEVILSENDGDLPVSEAPNAVPQEGGEWTKSLDTLSYDADSYLWMSQRKISADGIPALWEKPIRLSGADGDPGKDAFDTEFIYHRSGRKPTSDDDTRLFNDNIRSQDDYYPNNSYWIWTDNPQGVDDDDPEHKYEWMAFRTKMDSSHDDYNPEHPEWVWSNWSTIRIWSAYGEKGMDGDGIQYIYNNKFVPTESVPKLAAPQGPIFKDRSGISHTWNGDVYYSTGSWYPKDWEDGIFDQWEGGNYNPQGEWIPGGSYNDQGQFVEGNWTDEPQGVGDFEIANTAFVEDEPVSETNPETITVTHPFEWVSTRKRVREVWGPFSEPTLWSTFSREHTVEIGNDGYWWIDGKPTGHKAEGEDGKGIDLKGRVDFLDSNHETRFMQENPNFSFEPGHVVTYLKDVDDETSNDFRDPEVGDCYVVTYNGHIYLYVGGEDADWTKHWHNFGEFQGEGAYVHIAWAETITIEDGHVHSSGFVLDKELSDNIAGLDWMGIYTDNKINDSEDEDDYKWNYLRGRDGDNIERVYIRTAVEVTPEIEYTVQPNDVRVYPEYPADDVTKTYQSQEYLPFVANPVDDNTVNPPVVGCQPDGGTYVDSLEKFQFTDDPLGVTSTLPYEWMSERKKRDGEWKYFSTPSLHATYSHNGQSIIRSTIFRRWDRLDQAPQRPGPTFGSYEYPAGEIADPDWKDGIPAGTGAIWKSERVFTSDTRPPQWDNWSIPTLVQDDDNYDVELSIQARDTTPVPPVKYDEATTTKKCNSHHPAEGEEGYNSDLIADQQLWFDPVLDADYITENNKKFNWMATRTKYVNSSNLPEWRPWTIVLIKGEDGGTGPAGIGFQHAYIVITGNKVPNIKVNPEDSTEFISDVSGATGTWQLDTTNGLTVGPKQYLWMAERTVQSGVYGLWGDPVKISGEGTPGEDAEDIEFVYKQESRLPNNTSQNSDVPGYTTYTDINGKEQVYSNDDYIPEGWTDSPLGVSTEFKYEWMCQRIKPRTGDIEDPDNPWGPWSNVFVWSAYGDTGMDGDGVEYVFTVDSTLSSSTPASPRYKIGNSNTEYDWTGEVVNTEASGQTPIWKPKGEDLSLTYTWVGGGYNLQGEWIPTGWSDEPHGVGYFDENGTEVLYSYEWVSIRKRISGEWKEFSPPSLWSNFSKRQTLTIGDDGYWYDEDNNKLGRAEGEAGTGIELKDTLDVKFNRDKHSYALDNGISDETTVKSLQDIHPTSRTDTTSQYKDIQPGDCYVVKDTRHLYVCRHSKSNWDFTDNASTINDNTWDANKNWSDVGEFLGKGSYMHIAWAASKDPKREIQGDNIVFNEGTGTIKWIKYFVTDYLDKLPNVDYDWMGVYSDYDQLDPPSNFDLTANDGTTTDGKALNSSLYKWNNVRGRDGDNYERVYVKSKGEGEGYKPELPSTYESYNDPETGLPVTFQDPEYRPVVANYVEGENPSRFSHTRFTDDPTGVSEDYPYEWMCERKKKLNTTTHQVEWFPFSPPALWAKYSFNGDDGKSVQTRYVAVPKKTGLTIDQGYESALSPVSTVEGTPYTWQPNTSSYSSLSTGMYLWMTQRSTSDPDNDITTEWEIPIRLSGEDGKAGEDGADIEFVYLRNNDAASPPAPANPTAKNKSNNRTTPYYGDVEKVGNAWIPKTWDTENNDAWSNWEWYSSAGVWNNDGEWIPVGWSDNPKGVGFFTEQNENHQDVEVFYKYEWACQRTKSAGNNQNWTQWIGPFRWSAYGDTGMDGDGIEYVYYRWDGTEPLVTPSEPKLKRIAPGETAESIISWNKRVEKVPGTSNPVQWQPKAEDWDESVYGSFNSWDSNSGKFNDQGEWIPIAKKRNSEQQEIVITTGEHPNEVETYWTDDPQGVGKETTGSTTTYYICEWVSVRKRINGGDWSTFSPPKLWASFGSDVKIIGGDWYINGVYSGKAEGEDGKGVALKGTVDVLNRSDRRDYARANGIEDYTTVKALQDIQPTNSLGISSINIGDCYVVKQNRYLYTSKSWFNSTDTPDDRYWNSTDQTTSNWWGTIENPGPGQNNWAEIGEFQGADGESRYMHIAWATDEAVKRADDGTILLVNPFIIQHEQLDRDTSYEWMGVCTSEEELDPPNDYDSKYNSSLAHDNGAYGEYESYEAYVKDHPLDYNWHLYKWNHVKGKDGSDYEKVYIKTKTNTGTGPGVNQSAYQGTSGHNDPTKDEFYPQVLNYDNNPSDYSNPTFTDDPTGPTATYPYEWVAERRKKLNPTTQSMEWGPFNSPATLWAMYAFEGMTAYLTKSSDSLTIDAANNPVGSLNSSRLYTEVKIYDPKANNGSGQYLTYTSLESNLDKNKFCITSATSTVSGECTVSKTTSGRVYISAISSSVLENKNKNSCSVSITAKVYGGKTFNFTYTVTFNRIPQTYLSYTLTNDSDTFTYRTRTKQYDGLPIETSLDVITTDGTITKLNDNTDLSIFDGYISSVTVKGKGDSNFLKYAKVTHLNGTALTGTNIQTVSSTNKTVTVESSELDDTVTHNTKTITIYTNNNYDQATGLALDICSNGTITLKRTGDSESTDIDLADTSHDLDITCVAELGGATYSSLVKTFKLSERNDATLYKLILSGDSFVKKEDGSGYLPSENTFSVNVNIIDGTGSSIESPSTVSGSLGLIRDRVFVRYLYNRAATSPSRDASYLKSAKPDFDDDITSNFFTVLVVEYDSNNVPTTYHDTETVNIVPPGVSTAYLDINFDRIVVDCDNTGKIINNDQSFTIEAYLRWGNLTCTSFTTKTFSVSGIGYTSTNKNYSLSTVSVIDDSEDEEYGKVYATITFKKDKTLTSGYITVRLKGTFSNGLTKDLTRNIEIQANRTGATGPQGPHGNFKATAFTRTYDIISNLIPSGGDYDSRNYPDPTIVGSGNNAKTYTWHDGIPEGEETLWSTTGTFLGANYPSGPSSWSNPSIVQDSEIYDVEFAERQEGGSTPSIPIKYEEATAQNPCNSHVPKTTDPGYVEGTPTTAQIWYDPILDKTALSGISSNIYWKAERTVENGTKGNWIITQIKGESEPWVSVNKDRFTFDVDPTGKLSSVPTDSDKTLTIRLKLGNIVQQLTFVEIVFTAFSESSTTVRTYSTSATSSTYRLTITNDSETGDSYVSFVLPISSTTTVYAPQRNLEITAKTNIYEATKTVKVEFDRKNRSSFKSFVFKRFASTPSASDAPSTTATGGSYENNGLPTGTSGRDSGWSDGLPADGGTDPIYMSSRTFYSDGQPSNDSWSVPIKMSDTDLFNVEFSPQNSQPAAPNGSNQNGGSGTQIWFDPVLDKYTDSTHTTLRDFTQMKWMATSTSKDNNGNWTNWVVVRIKGETGESQHIDSTDAYYKIFNTLNVQMPADDDEEGLAAWTTTQIEPTEELPYLWRFFRTEYSNPPRAENYGLELVQVWSENMINPNLFDNPDFDVEDVRPNDLVWPYSGTSDAGGTMGAWTTWQVSNTQFWTSWGKNYGLGSNYPEIGPENGYNYYGGIHDVNTNLSGTGYVVVLKQFIYKKEDSTFINKVSAGNWYTLSFWMKGFPNFHNDSLQVKILSRNSSNTNSSGTGLLDNTSSNKVYVNNTAYTTSTSIISFSYNNTISYNNFNSSWNKYTITFKIKDSIPNDVITCHIEWTLSVSNPATKKGGILLSKPKLEVGKLATRYISSRIKDPYPRVTKWKVGEMYYQGRYGEPYLDIVSYEGQWFRCRLTHISNDGICTGSGHLGEYNSSVDFRPIVGTTNTWWEPANNFDFISTNLLLAETAVIDNLIATSLRTGERGVIPHVEMSGSRIEFYGTGMNPSIRFNVDASGAGILEFLDNDGNVLYNLGPNGITRLVDAMDSTYANSALYKITSSTYVGDLITISGNAVNPSITGNSFNITNKYTLTEGYQKMGGVTKYRISNDSSPSAFNGRMFDGNRPSDSTLSQYLTNNNAEDYSTLFSDETNWYITLNYGPILSFSAIDEADVVYTMSFHQYSKGRLSKTVTIYFSETEVRNAASNLRQLYGHRIVNNVVKSNLKILPLLNL